MITRSTFGVFAILGLLCVPHADADEPASKPSRADPPGGIKLLPGYEHKSLPGIDTTNGKIWKKDGVTIEYVNGKLAGNQVEEVKKAITQTKKDSIRWYKEQTVGGQPVQLLLTKDRTLYATVPEAKTGVMGGPANFKASPKSDEDLADVLLMVLTFRAEGGPK